MADPVDHEIAAIVCRIYYLCGASTRCHVARERVLRGVVPLGQKEARRYLRRAINQGYVYEKRHAKGRRSYGLTRRGVELALKVCREA